MLTHRLILSALIGITATGAGATTVSFGGLVVNLCVLTVSTPGTLGLSADGTTLSSESTGGIKAVMAVVSTGASPTLTFSAPALTGPAASTGGAVKAMKFTSPGGAAQAFTSGSASYAMNRLLDTLTIDAKATNADGFASGSYTLSSTATCQQ